MPSALPRGGVRQGDAEPGAVADGVRRCGEGVVDRDRLESRKLAEHIDRVGQEVFMREIGH